MSSSDDLSFATGVALADGALGPCFTLVLLGFGAADTLTTSAAASSPTGHLRFAFSNNFSMENIPFLSLVHSCQCSRFLLKFRIPPEKLPCRHSCIAIVNDR